MAILLRLSTLFLLAFSVLLSTVSARPQVNMGNVRKRTASPTSTEKYLTNAARMVAGLGPMTPRNLFNPTRANVARADPSVQPLSGRIKVTGASNGEFIGYVDKNYRPDGSLPANTNANAQGTHLTVTFTKPISAASLFDIFITSNGNPSHPNLGFAHASDTLQTTNFESTVLTGTNPTTPGGVATQVGNGMSSTRPYSESPIWSYDASNSRLSTTWLNPSSPGSSTGVPVAVKIYYSALTNALVQSRTDMTVLGLVEVFFTLE